MRRRRSGFVSRTDAASGGPPGGVRGDVRRHQVGLEAAAHSDSTSRTPREAGAAADTAPCDGAGVDQCLPAQSECGAGRDGGSTQLVSWLIERGREPSTWRGLAAALCTVGVLAPDYRETLVAVGLALVAVIDVVRREG